MKAALNLAFIVLIIGDVNSFNSDRFNLDDRDDTEQHPTGRQDSKSDEVSEVWLKLDPDERHNHDKENPSARKQWHNGENYADITDNNLFRNILEHISKGQVTQESLNHWLSQINNAMAHGSISQENVATFIALLKEKLAGSSVIDNCCLFG